MPFALLYIENNVLHATCCRLSCCSYVVTRVRIPLSPPLFVTRQSAIKTSRRCGNAAHLEQTREVTVGILFTALKLALGLPGKDSLEPRITCVLRFRHATSARAHWPVARASRTKRRLRQGLGDTQCLSCSLRSGCRLQTASMHGSGMQSRFAVTVGFNFQEIDFMGPSKNGTLVICR